MDANAQNAAEADAGRSLDQVDRESFAPRFTPWDGDAVAIALSGAALSHPAGAPQLCLDGDWQLAEGGKLDDRLGGDWSDAIPAQVPGSVHTALVAAGRLPDPTYGLNQKIARAESFKTWWMRREFTLAESFDGATLAFGGVANRCTVWLNGKMLGSHEGLFGGPDL